MRPPEFWYQTEGREAAYMLRTLLAPFSWIYARATAKRIKTTVPFDPLIPVICVGNASVGGTGKTPIAAYLLESLTRMGMRAVILSRGYGGTEKGPMVVGKKHTAADVGDEPLLLSRKGPVWVSIARDDGAKAAASHGAQVIIMDDGHQNPLVKKTLSLLVVDAEIGFGNDRVIPAGPLREPSETALARADAIILMKPTPDFKTDEDLLARFKGKPMVSASLVSKMEPPSGKLYAFAGIGRPNKFFDALRRAGGDVVEGLSYADHHAYKDTDMMDLIELSREYDAQLITTEKDYVRVPKSFQQHVLPWPVHVQFEDELTLRRLLHPIVSTVK
ncbi:MAG: tetraacyldisaccharide 4'-kinase [Acidimicrobiales bacterium]|nr:tetraacyldisaccharide 4'-kinase [Hyphomonadaceae bacterium]RZV44424.1 MAG: tetraacyldisaccharide 4'-kinase [Acidimicrobiales bacterium]